MVRPPEIQMTNECPHPRCFKKKPREKFACYQHWMILPKPIRDKIWDGYRGSAGLWIEAHDEAIEYWNGKRRRDGSKI